MAFCQWKAHGDDENFVQLATKGKWGWVIDLFV